MALIYSPTTMYVVAKKLEHFKCQLHAYLLIQSTAVELLFPSFHWEFFINMSYHQLTM